MSTSVHSVPRGGDGGGPSLGLLQSITVTQPPAKTAYYQNDVLDLAGIEVTATYMSEGPIYSTKVVTAECTYSPNTGDTLSVDGIQTINITFTEGEASVQTTTTVSVKPFIVDWATGDDTQIERMVAGHYLGTINLHDYWAVGQIRPVQLTTGENIELVLMHEGEYPLAGEPVDTPVSNLSVGSIIQLNENGAPVDYIIVHQGKPSDMYDDSCDGTWVLRKDIRSERAWDSSDNNYMNSDIHSYLNGTFLNLFDDDIKNAIKQVKIPYQNGTGSGGSVASGANGLSCKIFLLSGYEVGFSTSDSSYFPRDGAKLSYFSSGTGSAANNKRIANYNGSASIWWLRSPHTNRTYNAWSVDSNGNYYNWNGNNTCGGRPALVLDSSYTVKIEPTCAFVVGMKDCMNTLHVMNDSSTNTGGWNNCEMRTYLNNTVYNQLPNSIKQILKKMNIWTANGGSQSGTTGTYSEDYLALAAEKEVVGANSYGNDTIEAKLFQFEWYKTAANRIKKVPTLNQFWWLRTPLKAGNNGFCLITEQGVSNGTYSSEAEGVSFFGCI